MPVSRISPRRGAPAAERGLPGGHDLGERGGDGFGHDRVVQAEAVGETADLAGDLS